MALKRYHLHPREDLPFSAPEYPCLEMLPLVQNVLNHAVAVAAAAAANADAAAVRMRYSSFQVAADNVGREEENRMLPSTHWYRYC